MSVNEDIKQIIRQEEELIFHAFDEETAFSIGHRIWGIAQNDGLSIAVEISLWDRRLFYAATAGATFDNQEWLRRKFNTVRRFHASTYRLVLEQQREDKMSAPHKALDVADYALAGEGFLFELEILALSGRLSFQACRNVKIITSWSGQSLSIYRKIRMNWRLQRFDQGVSFDELMSQIDGLLKIVEIAIQLHGETPERNSLLSCCRQSGAVMLP